MILASSAPPEGRLVAAALRRRMEWLLFELRCPKADFLLSTTFPPLSVPSHPLIPAICCPIFPCERTTAFGKPISPALRQLCWRKSPRCPRSSISTANLHFRKNLPDPTHERTFASLHVPKSADAPRSTLTYRLLLQIRFAPLNSLIDGRFIE